MKLTKKQAIHKHRAMWRWIKRQTLIRKKIVEKTDYFAEHKYKHTPRNLCFCCEYAKDTNGLVECKQCPLEWGGKSEMIKCQRVAENGIILGMYGCWIEACRCGDYVEAAELAGEIAELPEKF